MPNFTVNFHAMGTSVSAWLNVNRADEADALLDAPRWFEMCEAALSRFRPSSELCHLNAHSGQWVRVLPIMFQVVAAAVDAAEKTGGLVNPLILPALEAAGYDHSFDGDHFTPGAARPAAAVPDWRDIALDPVESTIRLPRNARIDLGGIAKGWAVQRLAERLSAVGPCLVNAGGDMVARGTPVDSEVEGWLIKLPIYGEPKIQLIDAAVATSGTNRRRWVREGQELHHLIDPRTGLPAQGGVLTATVIAPDAVDAEAFAKAALISGDFPHPDFPTLLVHTDGTSTDNALFHQVQTFGLME